MILLLVALAIAWGIGYGITKIPGAKELFAKIGTNIKKVFEIDLNRFLKKDMHNFFNQGALYRGVGVTLAVILGTLGGVAAIGYCCQRKIAQRLLLQAQNNVDADSWQVQADSFRRA